MLFNHASRHCVAARRHSVEEGPNKNGYGYGDQEVV